MFFQAKRTTQEKPQTGFTLLELLVVIALLAIVAGVLISGYGGVQDQGRADATKFEMAELRKALLQFRRDSGSNDFPTVGVYDCDDDPFVETTTPNPRIIASFPSYVASLATDAEKVAWCKHPANFWMLFENPLDDNNWDPDTHRGWNGPYLQRKSGYLDIDADFKTDGTFAADSSTLINNVQSIASPFLSEPQTDGHLTWRSSVGSDDYANYGTPYLLFDLNEDDQARIVSMASDNNYNPIDTPNCEQLLDSEDNPIDNILCLLR